MMASEETNINVFIKGKRYPFRDFDRERTFFQLYIKVLKGAPCVPDNAVACFKENFPGSKFTTDELLSLLEKHEKRREGRDARNKAKKSRQATSSPTGGQVDEMLRTSTSQCDSEIMNDIVVNGDSEISKSRTSLKTATENDPLPGIPSPLGGTSSSTAPVLRTSGGWAAEPKQIELTAWERELLRRRERAQGERESSIGEEPVPEPQRSNSPSLPSSDITEKRVRTRGPSHSEERESQDMAAITRKSGANSSTRASKERKIRKGEDKETMQKMMAELLDKTNNIQGRIAQLESTSSSVPQGTPVSTTIGSHRNRNTPTVTSFSNPHPADEDILRLVRCDGRGRTLLHEASLAGRVDEVQELLSSGADADVKDGSERTPLMLAASLGLLPIVHLLSSRGASINERDRTGNSCLLLAAKGGHIACIQYLHLRGANLGVIDIYGRSSLHHAVGLVADTLKAMLELSQVTSAPISSAGDVFGSSRVQVGGTPLCIDQRDLVSSQTPLHYAAAGGYTTCVEELLSAGAQLTTDYNGVGPLALSVMSGNTTSTQTIIGHMSANHGWGPIHEASISGVNIQSAIQTNKDIESAINQSDAVGQTPLLLATMVGNSTSAEYLISKGSDVNLRDQLGRTALHHAASKGNLVLCKTLVRAGSSIDVEDAFRYTALHLAILYGYRSVVEFLSGQGADHLLHKELSIVKELVARQSPSRSDLIVRAFKSDLLQPDVAGQAALVQELNSEVRSADQHGRTALHIAAFVGDDKAVGHLLSLKMNKSVTTGPHCNIHITDNKGWTALHYAVARDTIRCPSEPTADLSAVALTPNQSRNMTLTWSSKKNERQVAVIRLLLQANGGFGSGVEGSQGGSITGIQDIRRHRAHDGRRPVDLAVDEMNTNDILELLQPPANESSCTDGYWAYRLTRWAIVLLCSIAWGLLGLTCCILYLLFAGESVASLLSQPLILLFDKASWLRRKLSLWYNNDTDYDYDRSKGRTRRAIVCVSVVSCVLVFVIAPLLIVVSHRSDPYESRDLFPNSPQDAPTSESKYDLVMLMSEEPLINRTKRSITISETVTDQNGINFEWDSPRDGTISTDGQRSRDIGVSVMCSILLLITLVVVRRVFVDAREGRVAARALTRKVNFSKKGNWWMLFCAVLDPLIMAAVPFTILDAEDDKGFLPTVMKSLVLDTFNPLFSASCAAFLMFIWVSFSGLSSLTSSVTSSEVLSKRMGIVHSSTLHCVPPGIIHFLSHTLYLPIVVSTLRLFKCTYTHDKVVTNFTADIECYDGMHAILLVICVSLLIGYVTTCCTIGILMSQPRGGVADVYWGPAVLSAEKLVLTATATTITLVSSIQPLCHVILFFLGACLLIYAGRVDDKVPSIATIVQWRMLGYTFAEMSLATCAFVFKQQEVVAGTLIFALSLLISILVGIFLYRYNSTRMLSAERESAFRRLAAVHVLDPTDANIETPQEVESSARIKPIKNNTPDIKDYSFMEMGPIDQPVTPKPPLPGDVIRDTSNDNNSNTATQKPAVPSETPADDWIFVSLNEAHPSAATFAV